MRSNYEGSRVVQLFVTTGLTAICASFASPAPSRANLITDYEALIYIARLNQAQQIYYLNHDKFANKLSLLGRYPSQTINYKYVITVPKGLSYDAVAQQAQPQPNKPSNKAVIGGVAIAIIGGEPVIVSLRCKAARPPAQGGPKGTELPIFGANGAISCPTGYSAI